jgi:hypothetical protein
LKVAVLLVLLLLLLSVLLAGAYLPAARQCGAPWLTT